MDDDFTWEIKDGKVLITDILTPEDLEEQGLE
jgi:hypothetical protein